MNKKTLRKDIRKSFSNSWGRFFSILCLMILGSFALVGLKVTGPNMRATSENYFNKLNLADISIIGDYGIDDNDQGVINSTTSADEIEYGYLKDVIIKDSKTSFRIYSSPETISTYELVKGRIPETDNEIAISSEFSTNYKIGDSIQFSEKEDTFGNTTLTHHEFEIVGFINSSEIISTVNLGETSAGTGDLKGYAVVIPEVFGSDVYMIARLTFKNTKYIDPYSTKYINLIQEHKEELQLLLQGQPQKRLDSVKLEYQEQIDEGQDLIDKAKQKIFNAEEELDEAKSKIDEVKTEVTDSETKLNEAESQVLDSETKLDTAKTEIANNEVKINTASAEISSKEQELENQKSVLAEKQQEYQDSILLFNQKQQELENAQAELNESQNKIDTSKVSLEAGKSQYEASINLLEQQITVIDQALSNPDITSDKQAELESQLALVKGQLEQVKLAYGQFMADTYQPNILQLQSAQELVNQKQKEVKTAQATLQETESTLATAKQQLEEGYQKISSATKELNTAKAALAENKQKLIDAKNEIAESEQKLANAKNEITENEQKLADAKSEIADKEQEYEEKLTEFQDAKIDAENEIAENEQKLLDAQGTLDELKVPIYSLSSRRETLGSIGYKMYDSISNIIDSLANVFPIFLYFVAALVTFTTMTRFVDDERTNSGTLKALGYSNQDIIKKFTIYGLFSSTLGSIIGIILGHRLLPAIVYNAYQTGFSIPQIEFQFNWGISIAALLLAFVSAVVPAYVVAKKELKERPATLLLPKPPTAGSKILLEYITPIWNRLSFTHKVTARNIFRYKKRMFMTIFGVCGAVALLFTGFGVQKSISGIGDRQFGEIIHYDLIVAQNDNLKVDQLEEIEDLLNSDVVSQQTAIYYEELSKAAGKSNDSQVIKLLVPENSDTFNEYINLVNRKTGNELPLEDDGAILSERLAKLIDVEVGDIVTLKDSKDEEVTIKVAGITEMYIGHFLFMNTNVYQQAFNQDYSINANLVTLKDGSQENTEKLATEFMNMSGIKGVVQNTTLTTQIETIVQSLDKIMKVLIVVATLLAIVILYNLTNINVAERIRELSTIKVLGFYNGEVTMYIYRETLLLSLLGIFVGYGFGILLHRYILTAVPPDDVMFNPSLWASTFIIPALIIAITTVVLGVFIGKTLEKVNMLEALKSVE